ncbi:MAG: Phospholipase D-nuclease N-terminal [Solirubrobacteraceae bacterium]|jgi:hypothetical protein|nr:Phospholipase D-nuclease N-terminal [Solirubrobacteraceae bacterium]
MPIIAASTFLQALFVCLIVIPIALLWGIAVVEIVRERHGGWDMVGWLLVVCILPIIGPILYFAFRPPPVTQAEVEETYRVREEQRREAARRPTGGTGVYR